MANPRNRSAGKVWFLTGSQALYGPETLDQVAAQSEEIARELGGSADIGAEIAWQPVLTDSAAIRRMMLDANSDDDCLGVIAWMHTFSPAKMWITGLDALRKPLLHLHTQANAALPWATIDMEFMNLNQAAHGDREFGYIQSRLGVARKTVAGHVSDPSVAVRVGRWVAAARGFARLRTLRLARFGDNMREVAVTEGDKVEAELRFGVSVNTYGVNDLVAVVDAVDDKTIDDLVAEYADRYEILPALQAGAARHDSLRYAARIEAGLRQFLAAGGFGAFTTNFQDLGGLRQLPGLAVQRLMADGFGFGGEGDWKTSTMLAAVKAMSPGGTSFMEDYTYHWSPGPPKVLGAHMLEVCPSIAATRPTCEIHPLSIGNREDPVRLVFDATPGPGIVLGIADIGDRFRLVLNEIEVVAPDEPLPKLPVARAVWAPAPSLSTSAECWLTAGGPHHTVLSQAVDAETIEDFAAMLHTELLIIDGHTTPRTFVDHVRWNAPYYRLSGGLPGVSR
jgi:L-arabinose isomerase